MKKTALFTILTLTLGTYAFTHCGNCPGDKKAEPAAEAAQAGKKNCDDCPMHKKAAAGKKHNCPEAAKAAEADSKMCPGNMPGVEKSSKELSNGVEMIFTSKDKTTVTKVQELVAAHHSGKDSMKSDCLCNMEGAETSVENMPDGVKVIITGKTAELITKIQASAKKHGGKGCANCGGHGKKKAAKASKKYACPMNCATSDKPGKCPKCGMPMEEKK